MHRPLLLLVTIAAGLAPFEAEAGPWEDLMGPGKPRMWTDPKARFYTDLAVGWEAKPRPDVPVVDFVKQDRDRGLSAHVQVEMRMLPPNVNTRHFALRVLEQTKKRAPQYRQLGEDRLKVSGVPAVRTHFTYRVHGNAAMQNEVVQTVFIVGERGFIVTLETLAGARGVFWEDFEKMLKGFSGRAPGEESRPLPKRRKRVKSGEMVNPDAVKY